MKPIKIIAMVAIGVSLVFAQGAVAKGGSGFAKRLPNFSLKDPVGKTFTKASLCKDGLVLVVTAPIMDDEAAQKGWDQHLSKAKAGSKAKWVYVEDMEPSSFKGMAMSGMKKDYVAGKQPILLIDTNGKLRRALKVPEAATVVLVYDRSGKLVHSETGAPSAQAAQKIWEKVKS